MSFTRGQLIGNGANGVLGSILARLERLERQRQGPNESLVPNSYTLDPNGNVNVTGINLPAGTSNTPANKNRIRWLRTDNGALVANLFGYFDAGLDLAELFVDIDAQSATGTSDAELRAVDDTGSAKAAVLVSQSSRGTTATVTASAGTKGARVLDNTGSSTFMQLGGILLSKVGTVNLTWGAAGATSNNSTVTLPGATGNVFGVALAFSVFNPGFFDFAIAQGGVVGGGQIVFAAKTAGGGAPGAAGTCTLAYVIWGT